MARVAVVLHERLGVWARQIRARLHDAPVRWYETRSAADADAALLGVACPVVLIDLSRDATDGLRQLAAISARSPGARVLVLDPEDVEGLPMLARELGASHVFSGFTPPPEVADLIARWVELAARETEQAGWSRQPAADRPSGVDGWLEAASLALDADDPPAVPPSRPSRGPAGES